MVFLDDLYIACIDHIADHIVITAQLRSVAISIAFTKMHTKIVAFDSNTLHINSVIPPGSRTGHTVVPNTQCFSIKILQPHIADCI